MLPLVSSAMPRLTGTRSALKCVTSCSLLSSKTTKSSCFRSETKRPERSVTVTLTFTSSTPLLKRKPSCPCSGTDDAASRADGGQRRPTWSTRIGDASSPSSPGLGRDGGRQVGAPIHVRQHRAGGAEAHAVARRRGHLAERDRERRLLARLERRASHRAPTACQSGCRRASNTRTSASSCCTCAPAAGLRTRPGHRQPALGAVVAEGHEFQRNALPVPPRGAAARLPTKPMPANVDDHGGKNAGRAHQPLLTSRRA